MRFVLLTYIICAIETPCDANLFLPFFFHTFFTSRCYLKGGYAIEKYWTTIEGDVSAARNDIDARKAIEFFFDIDQSLEMVQIPLVTILGRKMRLKNFWSRPTFGDVHVASVASHGIGARNAIEFFWNRPSFGDSGSAASHDIGARNVIAFFDIDQALEMVRVPLVTVVAREMRLKIFWSHCDQHLEMLRVPLVTILAREMRLKNVWNRPSSLDVVSAARHDIGPRNAIENDQALEMLRLPLVTVMARDMRLNFFLTSTKLWRCCECRWSQYWRKKRDWIFFDIDKL